MPLCDIGVKKYGEYVIFLNKKFELDDDMLDSVAGGVDNGTPRTDGKISAGIKCK